MQTSTLDYRAMLKDELERRCQRNTRYSLRAFARDIGMSSARLSEVLNSKVGISLKRAGQITKKLGFSRSEADHFKDLVESQHARSRAQRELARVRLRRYQFAVPQFERLKLDTFHLISDWYHMAILELICVKGFRNSTAWIAQSLGIRQIEAKIALERLERLSLITVKDGQLQVRDTFNSSTEDVPSKAIKNYHQQILRKAEGALFSQDVSKREISSATFALDSSRIAEAKAKLRALRDEFHREFSSPEANRDSVYCLAQQFFDLTPSLERSPK